MKKLLMLVAILTSTLHAQAPGPNLVSQNIQNENGTLYVLNVFGSGNATIQSTVTNAVALASTNSTKYEVDIIPSYAGADLISSVTGGSTAVWIIDKRALPNVCYTWQTSVYSSTGVTCADTGGVGSQFPITIGSTSIAANSTTTTIAGLTLTAPTFTAPVLGTPASGNGTNLTNLNGSNIATGTVADARLSANVPLLSASNTFTGTVNTFSSVALFGAGDEAEIDAAGNIITSASLKLSSFTGYLYANGSSFATASTTIPYSAITGGPVSGMTSTQVAVAGSATTITSSVAASITIAGSNCALGGSCNPTVSAAGTATNLSGGALGSVPYQLSSGTTTYVGSPTTSGHIFFLGWTPSGSAIAAGAIDETTSLLNSTNLKSVLAANPFSITNTGCADPNGDGNSGLIFQNGLDGQIGCVNTITNSGGQLVLYAGLGLQNNPINDVGDGAAPTDAATVEQLRFTGTSASIGGGALTAGTCASGTATVSGAVVGHPVYVSASDGTLPNALATLSASVTSANTVTVQICAIALVTPAAKTYNVATY